LKKESDDISISVLRLYMISLLVLQACFWSSLILFIY